MGGEQSNLLPMPLGFDYVCITVRYTDRLRVIYATEQEINVIREVIIHHWPRGIQEEMIKVGSAYEFKLRGNPFTIMTSAEEAINVRKLGAHLLFRLYNQGCKLLVSSDLAQTQDLSTWFFHREQTSAAQFNFACIGVSSTDKLQVIDFPSGILQIIQGVVEKNWPQTIQKTKMIGDALEIKLKGNPWMHYTGSAAENIQSKTLVKELINELDMRQWVLYGSSNLKGAADTLFFRYDPYVPSDGSRMAGFVISLNKNDRLRCIDAPIDAVNCVKAMITQFWGRGIQKEEQKFNAYEFKLAGTPWWADGQMAVDSRLLMCKIFEGLWSIGWKIQLAIDLSRKINDKSVLTFQRCDPIPMPIFCLSLNWTDKIRIINAPPDVTQAIANEIKRLWLFGVKRDGPYGASYELKLNGNPWSYGMNGHDGAHGRVLLVHLLKLCANMGCYLILSADISSKYVHQDKGPDYPIDVHSWWFMRVGQPVFAPTHQFSSSQLPAVSPSVPSQFGVPVQSNSVFPGPPPSYTDATR